ncbi:16S rRNA (guanine(966)-N(2))-methyltransferase RsmD [Nitrosomonas sp. JL21]|uniref:16S rRNA (guanine(966)-N(2))-methyltransferase RsmD n=1 Tax=Nitrosomonas sp. JL21 TaxID=153949 RepID=UPI0031F337B2
MMVSTRGKVRIIGGEWRSRLLTFPDYSDLRPTANRIRETVFNWLGQDLSGLNCLDLFAGSGALGFEAASRGAKRVVMVEDDARAYAALRENKTRLSAIQVELLKMNALAFLQSDVRQFDLIFLDPPYRLELLPTLLPLLPVHLEKDGTVYIETQGNGCSDKAWNVTRSGRAGKVCYQLLELVSHG